MSGFSLIELLIVISIASLLMLAGTSTYSQHLVKARRLQAANTLSELAVTMEEYHIEHGSYPDTGIEKLKAANNRYYEFKIESAADDDYVLAAVPRGVQAERDGACGVLQLHANGEKQFCE